MTATAADPTAQMQALVEQAIQRNIKGLEYFASPAPPSGASPKDLLVSRGTMNLWHYRAQADEVYRVPILLVMATTNRGYIFDMAPGQSFAEFLLKAGYDVFMLDWNAPRSDERHLAFEDYVLDFIPDSLARIAAETGESEVSIVGYCMGGVLSTLYAALHPDGPLKNLVTFTTPIDFSQMGLFAAWSDEAHFDVDRLVDTLGNIPPDMLFSAFDALRPASRLVGNIRLWDNMWNDEYVKSFRMFDRWSTDMLPLAGEYFRQTTKELMWKNGLVNGGFRIGGREVDIRNIRVPLLHVVAEHDHIVPYAASAPLIALAGSADKEEVVLKGGHVSLVAGANAQKRLWPRLDLWLQERSL
jgi:polyhydroxyalkanoate synthase subunit PhaC